MNVGLREEALDDLRRIRDWYVARNPVVARAMISRVQDRLNQLTDFPEIGAIEAGRPDRTLYVPGTPLVVVYRIDATSDLVDVIAGVDARRDPLSRRRP
ncbi:type II toxin-antitoxin system RelE/ParE family toxin [Hansschlegelia zhihuaiae]|uniref:Type II toxin-antitoxin system RelE/ParE family toxin n=1 Tax=Hansschlegelia zhihuaiae TaxID=405005 RepID=A0A4Q0MMV2_9HYPH|nr:type II toxin-antitoxin system RelE/ParE family toxin [Hansschlegelia zhihuaiae]RXF74933.1 type II toxin-antitoxin system RelE/ParE family toxin [Hansschlegelia zhihuaiae]